MVLARPVCGLADVTLSLADILFQLALGFLRAITSEFARTFLHGAFGLTLDAFFTILVHGHLQLPARGVAGSILLATQA